METHQHDNPEIINENLKLLQKLIDESSNEHIKGAFISALLTGLERSPPNLKEVYLKNINQMRAKGDVKILKDDKKRLSKVIKYEIDIIKKEIENIKDTKNSFLEFFKKISKFYNVYSKSENLFNEKEGFFWVSDSKDNNINKIYALNNYLTALGIKEFEVELNKVYNYIATHNHLFEFFYIFTKIKKEWSSLIGLDQNELNQDKLNSISVSVIITIIENKNKDKEYLKKQLDQTFSIELNKKINEMVKNCGLLLLQKDVFLSYFDNKIKEKELQIAKLNEDLSDLKKISYIPSVKRRKGEDSMVKVLMLTHEYEKGGGVSTVARKLTKYLLGDSSVVVDVLVHPPPFNLLVNNSPYIFYLRGRIGNRLEIKTLNDVILFLSNMNYDIIHNHSLSFAPILKGGLSEMCNLNANSKVIYTCHSVVGYERLVQGKYRPWGELEIKAQDEIMDKAAKIVHLTNNGAIIAHGSREEFFNLVSIEREGFYKQYRQKAVIIPNGIEITHKFFDYFWKLNQFYRKVKNKETINMAYIGRLAEEKGVIQLAKVFPKIADKYPIKLIVIGEEHKGTHVKDIMLYNLKGNEDKYEFKGWLEGEELERAWEDIDIVIVPSINESFSIVALDAYAHWKPVIISNIDGPRELFVEPKFAIGIDPKDEESILKAVEKCFREPHILSKMIEGAREEIKKRYNWSNISEQYSKLYLATMKGEPFESDFIPSNTPVILASSSLNDSLDKGRKTKIGLYYDEEFWSSFIHLLERKGYEVSVFGTSMNFGKSLESFVAENDIILSCNASADNWVKIVEECKRQNKPIILRYGGGSSGLKQDNLAKEEYKKALREATVVAPTDLLSSEVLLRIGIPKDKQVIIPNPIDFEEIENIFRMRNVYKTEDFKEILGLPKDKCVIGFIGRIDPVSNIYYLADAYEGMCEYLKNRNIENNCCLFIAGKLMYKADIPKGYINSRGKFGNVLNKKVIELIRNYGGRGEIINFYGKKESIRREVLGRDNNVVYLPQESDINRIVYLNYLKACDVVVLMVGGGVGSCRGIGEALALGRQVITLDAGTNPFSYGPAAIFVNRLDKSFKYEGIDFYAPDTKRLLEILLSINDRYKSLINTDNKREIDYVKNVMSSEYLVNYVIVPLIEIIKATYDPKTKYVDYSRVRELFKINYIKMESGFNPNSYL